MGMASSDDEERIMREHYHLELMKRLTGEDHTHLTDDERAYAEYPLLEMYKALRGYEPSERM